MKKYVLVLLIVFLATSLKANLFEHSLRIVGTSERDTQQAKLEAISQGREDSLMFVISKITDKQSQERIKELLQETKPITFEKRFSLSRENITNKKYEADALFVFDEEKIKEFLDANDIPFVSVPLGRYMIIPAFYDESGIQVEDNIWSSYWEAKSNEAVSSTLSTLIYYNNPTITTNKVNLLEIKKNLNLDEIFLLSLHTEKDGTFTLEIKNALTDKINKISGIPSIQQATMIVPLELEEDKKVEFITNYLANSSTVILSVATANYEDWIFIENKLKDSNNVGSFVLNDISTNVLKVKVHLKTNMEKFKNSMEANCVFFDIPNLTLSKITECNG
ncbi:MAG: hypothetical protein LBH40_07060 [Alphaproteobacteria bacterium]|jgi:hypothetical protein|nr:hypothetical protein [Alphaproteobacteria bacterium]